MPYPALLVDLTLSLLLDTFPPLTHITLIPFLYLLQRFYSKLTSTTSSIMDNPKPSSSMLGALRSPSVILRHQRSASAGDIQ